MSIITENIPDDTERKVALNSMINKAPEKITPDESAIFKNESDLYKGVQRGQLNILDVIDKSNINPSYKDEITYICAIILSITTEYTNKNVNLIDYYMRECNLKRLPSIFKTETDWIQTIPEFVHAQLHENVTGYTNTKAKERQKVIQESLLELVETLSFLNNSNEKTDLTKHTLYIMKSIENTYNTNTYISKSEVQNQHLTNLDIETI